MASLQRRFPQANVMSYNSEDDMIGAIIRWRRNYVNDFEARFGDYGDEDDILRFDTCINGYGMLSH